MKFHYNCYFEIVLKYLNINCINYLFENFILTFDKDFIQKLNFEIVFIEICIKNDIKKKIFKMIFNAFN